MKLKIQGKLYDFVSRDDGALIFCPEESKSIAILKAYPDKLTISFEAELPKEMQISVAEKMIELFCNQIGQKETSSWYRYNPLYQKPISLEPFGHNVWFYNLGYDPAAGISYGKVTAKNRENIKKRNHDLTYISSTIQNLSKSSERAKENAMGNLAKAALEKMRATRTAANDGWVDVEDVVKEGKEKMNKTSKADADEIVDIDELLGEASKKDSDLKVVEEMSTASFVRKYIKPTIASRKVLKLNRRPVRTRANSEEVLYIPEKTKVNPGEENLYIPDLEDQVEDDVTEYVDLDLSAPDLDVVEDEVDLSAIVSSLKRQVQLKKRAEAARARFEKNRKTRKVKADEGADTEDEFTTLDDLIGTDGPVEVKPVKEGEAAPVKTDAPADEVKPKVDSEGNPIVDVKPKVDSEGNPIVDVKPKVDSEGNPIVEVKPASEVSPVAQSVSYEPVASAAMIAKANAEGLDLILFESDADNPFWNVFLNGVPTAKISLKKQENAEDIRDVFIQDSYAKEVASLIEQLGFQPTMEQLKADFWATTEADGAKAARHKEAAEASLKVEKKAFTTNFNKGFFECLDMSIAGINKNFFPDIDNPLKDNLFENMKLGGLSQDTAVSIIENAFTDAAAPYFNNVIAKAVEYMNLTKEARSEIQKAIGSSTSISPLLNGDIQDTPESFSDKLARASVIPQFQPSSPISVRASLNIDQNDFKRNLKNAWRAR